MASACEILDLSSSELYIASQRVTVLPDKENKNKVITAAKNVLQATMKVWSQVNLSTLLWRYDHKLTFQLYNEGMITS